LTEDTPHFVVLPQEHLPQKVIPIPACLHLLQGAPTLVPTLQKRSGGSCQVATNETPGNSIEMLPPTLMFLTFLKIFANDVELLLTSMQRQSNFDATWNNSRSLNLHKYGLFLCHEQHGNPWLDPSKSNISLILPTVAKISEAIFTQINKIIATVHRFVEPYPNFTRVIFQNHENPTFRSN
jgi:hypothetical protein